MERHEEGMTSRETVGKISKNMTVTLNGAFHFHSGEFEEAEQKTLLLQRLYPTTPRFTGFNMLCLGYRRWRKGGLDIAGDGRCQNGIA